MLVIQHNFSDTVTLGNIGTAELFIFLSGLASPLFRLCLYVCERCTSSTTGRLMVSFLIAVIKSNLEESLCHLTNSWKSRQHGPKQLVTPRTETNQ